MEADNNLLCSQAELRAYRIRGELLRGERDPAKFLELIVGLCCEFCGARRPQDGTFNGSPEDFRLRMVGGKKILDLVCPTNPVEHVTVDY